ncbi:MAG: hypothetical protein Q8Q52_08755 [Acidimicrobiia bacterium]|nr:hypothetical protein [Acidimicrobiia bacterium]
MPDRSVILVDVPDGESTDVGFLEGLGHTVVVCHGPAHGTLCPILSKDGFCPKAEVAHGVVFRLDLDRPQHRAILQRYKAVLREDVPIRVATTPEQARKYATLLTGVQVWMHEPGTGDMDGFAAEVEAADRFPSNDVEQQP